MAELKLKNTRRKISRFNYRLSGLICHVCRRVARIWKRGGGGYFERVRSVQTTLTEIFIDLEAVSDGLSVQIESDFSAGIRNSKVFSAQNQVISKKKVFTDIETDFSSNFANSVV